ncbi:hypothetical protein T09_3228 [Trichinella sp. T9]|nr:hypothetical protein T09_3228 [Trichinella sp. T9]
MLIPLQEELCRQVSPCLLNLSQVNSIKMILLRYLNFQLQ